MKNPNLKICMLLVLLNFQAVNAQPINEINELALSKTRLNRWQIIGACKDSISDQQLSQRFFSRESQIKDSIYSHWGDLPIDLSKILDTSLGKIAYVSSLIYLKEERDVAFFINIADTGKLWINDKLIYSNLQRTGRRAIIKRVHLQKGKNVVTMEVKKVDSNWFYDLSISDIEYVLQNAQLSDHYLSCIKPLLEIGDSLLLKVSDTSFFNARTSSSLSIYNESGERCLYVEDYWNRSAPLSLKSLGLGVYKYELVMDKDTLTEYFCYGTIDKIFNSSDLKKDYAPNTLPGKTLLPYVKRLDRLLSDYRKNSNDVLERKIAFCLFKIREIVLSEKRGSDSYLFTPGLNLRTFKSSIDQGDEYYIIYVPPKLPKPLPIVIMVPYVTYDNPFYTGGIIANYNRLSYISKFADRYGLAVLWPSARIFKNYNQTPIITKSIIETIEDASKFYKIDRQKIFLYGECSGGLFAIQSMIRRPDLFAAIGVAGPELTTAVMNPSMYTAQLSNNIFNLTENFANKKILILHSQRDHKSPYKLSLKLIDSIKVKGQNVLYDNIKNVDTKNPFLYSEPLIANKIFSFFNGIKLNKSPDQGCFSTYSIYEDTIYGIFVKEKLNDGKAIVNYEIKDDQLLINTVNVRSLTVDISKLGINRPCEIFLNNKFVRQISREEIYNNAVIALKSEITSNKSENHHTNFGGPINKTFLKSFAVVRPTRKSPAIEKIISAVDSIWRREYKNSVPIINENKIDSARKYKINLLFPVADIKDIDTNILNLAQVKNVDQKLIFKGEYFQLQKMPNFVFAFSSKENNTSDLYIGGAGASKNYLTLTDILIKNGWSDFELWDGIEPLIQRNYF